MAHRVAWSPRAIEDLEAIAQYILCRLQCLCRNGREDNRQWAELSNHVCSTVDHAKAQTRYPPSLILAAWSESSYVEKRQRLFEQLLFAYRHGTIDQAHDYLISLHDSDWHKMRG